jgi:hypothetical protein
MPHAAATMKRGCFMICRERPSTCLLMALARRLGDLDKGQQKHGDQGEAGLCNIGSGEQDRRKHVLGGDDGLGSDNTGKHPAGQDP